MSEEPAPYDASEYPKGYTINGDQPRRFRLLHPTIVQLQEDNARLVKHSLERAQEIADLKCRISLLEEQRRTTQARLGDCLGFMRELRHDLTHEIGTKDTLAGCIELFLESN